VTQSLASATPTAAAAISQMVVKSSDVTVAITPCSSWLLAGRTNLSTFAGDPSSVIDIVSVVSVENASLVRVIFEKI